MKEAYVDTLCGKVAYYRAGDGGSVVFLHGWGQSALTFKNVIQNLRSGYDVISIDLPGFGLSDMPDRPLAPEDYVLCLSEIFKILRVIPYAIIAHSFGGRIALCYGAKYPTGKLILISAAGVKKRGLHYYGKIYRYKFLKRFYKMFSKKKYGELIAQAGSRDYRDSSGIMRGILVKAVNHNTIRDMKKNKGPVFLFWGVLDEETPYDHGLIMQKQIRNAQMYTFYKSGHFCYIDEEHKFIKLVNEILRG